MERHRYLAALLSLLVLLGACQHRTWPQWSCFAMNLDGVAWGSTIQETWELARTRGWRCRLESSVRADRFGMRCTEGAPGKASSFEFWFHRDALVSVALERSVDGPRGVCRPNPGFEAWSRAELTDLQARFGPSERTNPVEPQGRVEAHRWHTDDDEIVLRIYPDAQRLSIEGEDRGALRSLALRRSEQLALVRTTEEGVSEVAVAEEVAQTLNQLRVVEQSYYSEFGRYHVGGPCPPAPPRGAYVAWRQGEANGFDEFGFAPSALRTSCSYAVSVDPCEVGGACGYTAEAACDRRGDGEIEYWGLMHSSTGDVPPAGPFGMCRGDGVYSPDTGQRIGHDVVGLCRPRH